VAGGRVQEGDRRPERLPMGLQARVSRPPPSPYQSDARLSVSTGTLPGSHATPRPTRSAEALDLRVARERPAAAQAENVANAFGPPIDGVRRCPAVQMRHLSVFEDAVRAEEHRA
jgi:hypothetical protein